MSVATDKLPQRQHWPAHLGLICALVPIVGLCRASAQQTKPQALAALETSRDLLRSGRIDWTTTLGYEDRTFHHVSRYSRRGDIIYEFRGDDGGWCQFWDSQAKRGFSKYPQLYLRNSEGYWRISETCIDGHFWREDGRYPQWTEQFNDVRHAGLTPGRAGLSVDWGVRDLNDPLPEIVAWDETRSGPIYVVTGRTASGETVTYRINADKGWNAERITQCSASGEVLREAVCTLRQYDGVWLPERTDYFRGGSLVDSVRITRAQLNRSDDPARFTPTDLGFEVGTNVSVDNDPELEATGAAPVQMWDGRRPIAASEWSRLFKEGKLTPGPILQQLERTGRFESPYQTDEERRLLGMEARRTRAEDIVRKPEGLWEQYVRDFIARYQLDEPQAGQAWSVLKHCQKTAEDDTRRQRLEFIPLWTESQSAGQDFDRKKRDRMERLRGEIEARVTRIFEEDLCPRLDKIPTRAQRRAVEQREAAASRPATPKQ